MIRIVSEYCVFSASLWAWWVSVPYWCSTVAAKRHRRKLHVTEYILNNAQIFPPCAGADREAANSRRLFPSLVCCVFVSHWMKKTIGDCRRQNWKMAQCRVCKCSIFTWIFIYIWLSRHQCDDLCLSSYLAGLRFADVQFISQAKTPNFPATLIYEQITPKASCQTHTTTS